MVMSRRPSFGTPNRKETRPLVDSPASSASSSSHSRGRPRAARGNTALLYSTSAGGPGPRLADRNAGRGALPRGVVRALPRRRSLYAPARARKRLSGDRATADRDLVRAAAAGRGAPLPLLPAAVSGGGRGLRPHGIRPRHLVEPLRGQGGPRPGRRAPSLLLLHADALRVGPLRRLLRRPGSGGGPAPDAADGRAPPPLGPSLERPRRPVRRDLPPRRRADRALLRAPGRRDLPAGRGVAVQVGRG